MLTDKTRALTNRARLTLNSGDAFVRVSFAGVVSRLSAAIRVSLLMAATLLIAGQAQSQPSGEKNILFIAVDDLKPAIGAYGDPHAVTPNMDRLASQGTLFSNAHAQQAVCAPSRASLLTGYRPDQTKVWDLSTKFRTALPNVVTLPQRFKQNGYQVLGMGKIFDPRSVDSRQKMDAVSWSRPFINPGAPAQATYNYRSEDVVDFIEERREELGDIEGGWSAQIDTIFGEDGPPPTDRADVPDDAYVDGAVGRVATEKIDALSNSTKPFFLAVGFRKPHLPFNAPEKYWQLHDPEKLPLAEVTTPPEGAPSFAPQPGWELRNSYDVPDAGPIPKDQQRHLIHGYYAATSYIDAQIGRLLDALERNGVADNTIVVLWGDHGWHLGDHSIWAKHTNYEQATRSPLIISAPEFNNQGTRATAPVELLDIYPTLVDLAGLKRGPEIHGKSLRPILENPSASVKPAAVSQYDRNAGGRNLMGYAYRTERYRLVQWRDTDYREGRFFGEVVATELYDYNTDPRETENLASHSAYAGTLDSLEALAANIHARHHGSLSTLKVSVLAERDLEAGERVRLEVNSTQLALAEHLLVEVCSGSCSKGNLTYTKLARVEVKRDGRHTPFVFDVRLPEEVGVYTIRVRRANGSGALEGSMEVTVAAEEETSGLYLDGPNPFQSSTRLRVIANEGESIQAELYDTLGRRVRVPVKNRRVGPTRQTFIPLQAEGLASGVYFVRVTGDSFVEAQSVVRAK